MDLNPDYINTAVLTVLAWAIRALYQHVTAAITSHQNAVNTLTTRLAIIENDLKHLSKNEAAHHSQRRERDL